MEILLGEQQRKSPGFELDDRVRHLLDDHRGDALGRLVEQHEQRIAHQGARHGEHLLLAAAHLAAEVVAPVGEVREQGEQFFRGPLRRRRAVRERARLLPAHVEVLEHREVGKNAAIFRRVAEAEPGDPVGLEP